QALAGDSTDNVPGVPGIGVKTAAQLITEYGDLEGLLSRAHEIKQPKRREALVANAELARISKRLVQLDHNVPVEHHADTFDKTAPDPAVLIPWLEHMGFKRLLPRATERFGAAPAGAPLPDLITQSEVKPPHHPTREEIAQPLAVPATEKVPPIGAIPYTLITDRKILAQWAAEA